MHLLEEKLIIFQQQKKKQIQLLVGLITRSTNQARQLLGTLAKRHALCKSLGVRCTSVSADLHRVAPMYTGQLAMYIVGKKVRRKKHVSAGCSKSNLYKEY